MLCPVCQGPTRKFGKNRSGTQRFVCKACHKTFTDPDALDGRRVDPAQLTLALRMLVEGSSVRSAERLTGISRQTIIPAMIEVGQACERLMSNMLVGIPVNDVEADEIWGFVGCKEKTRERKGYGFDVGDAWCFVALERTNKLILA